MPDAWAVGRHQKGVVEILCRPSRDAAADGIRHRQLRFGWTENGRAAGCTAALITAFPARRAPPAPVCGISKSQGAAPALHTPAVSIAFRISCPPRLNSSRSTASSRSTFPGSGRPRSNHSPRPLHFEAHHLAKCRQYSCPSQYRPPSLQSFAGLPAEDKFVPWRSPRSRPARNSPIAARCR